MTRLLALNLLLAALFSSLFCDLKTEPSSKEKLLQCLMLWPFRKFS
jgi:hypothetical protein